MSTSNVTVSLDRAVIDMARAQARAAGLTMSAWVARVIRNATVAEAARRYEQFEREAADEMAAWDAAHPHGRRLAGAEW